MKALFLAGAGKCDHSYGNDYLFHGLCELLGFENVIDWPEKPPLHDGPDECEIDSDQQWPRKGHTLDEAVSVADLCIIALHPYGPAPEAVEACRRLPASVPIAACDFSDQLGDTRAWYESVAGRPLAAYFKRELPIEATWAIPCPLMYPYVAPSWRSKLPRVFYHATDHGGGAPGIPRRQIVEGLRVALPASNLDVALYPGQARGTRPGPSEYHERMSQSLVGIAWNGAANFDNNRFWENFAYGLACVAQRPWIQIPNPFVDGEHVRYAGTVPELVDIVIELVRNPMEALSLAGRGQEWFMRFHTSAARARWVLDHVW